jgi:hypothetical protein
MDLNDSLVGLDLIEFFTFIDALYSLVCYYVRALKIL